MKIWITCCSLMVQLNSTDQIASRSYVVSKKAKAIKKYVDSIVEKRSSRTRQGSPGTETGSAELVKEMVQGLVYCDLRSKPAIKKSKDVPEPPTLERHSSSFSRMARPLTKVRGGIHQVCHHHTGFLHKITYVYTIMIHNYGTQSWFQYKQFLYFQSCVLYNYVYNYVYTIIMCTQLWIWYW